MPSATLLAPALQEKLLGFVEVAFLVYILGSFLIVSAYVAGQLRSGTLLMNRRSPPDYLVPAWMGRMLLVSLIALFFMPLAFYLIVPAVAVILAADESAAPGQFGLRRLRPSRLIAWSILIGGAVIFLELPVMQLIELALRTLHLSLPEQSTVVTFRAYTRWSDILPFLCEAVIIAPIVEELFFRGFLFTFLKNHFSIVPAVIISAGVFAFAHVNLGSTVELWLLGMVLAVAYQHTGSLLLPMCVHGCFNLVTALSLLLDKGAN